MEESSKKDLADALSQMASGDIGPSAHVPGAPTKAERAISPSVKPIDLPEMEEAPTSDEDEWDEELVMARGAAEDMVRSPRPTRPAGAVVHRGPLYQTMKFRQTIIPILLTCGVLTLVVASLKFVMSADSLFSDLPTGLAAALGVAGVALLVLAVMNMLAVKNQASGR